MLPACPSNISEVEEGQLPSSRHPGCTTEPEASPLGTSHVNTRCSLPGRPRGCPERMDEPTGLSELQSHTQRRETHSSRSGCSASYAYKGACGRPRLAHVRGDVGVPQQPSCAVLHPDPSPAVPLRLVRSGTTQRRETLSDGERPAFHLGHNVASDISATRPHALLARRALWLGYFSFIVSLSLAVQTTSILVSPASSSKCQWHCPGAVTLKTLPCLSNTTRALPT